MGHLGALIFGMRYGVKMVKIVKMAKLVKLVNMTNMVSLVTTYYCTPSRIVTHMYQKPLKRRER